MKARTQRMLLIGLVLAGMVLAAAFAYRAFQENLLYFFSPSQIAAGEAPDRVFRLGGMVVKESVSREPGSLTVNFVVTDNLHSIPVSYTGVLPDLFVEGQGVVVRGRLGREHRGHRVPSSVGADRHHLDVPPVLGGDAG